MCKLLISLKDFGEALGHDQGILLPQHNFVAATSKKKKKNCTILKLSAAQMK